MQKIYISDDVYLKVNKANKLKIRDILDGMSWLELCTYPTINYTNTIADKLEKIKNKIPTIKYVYIDNEDKKYNIIDFIKKERNGGY